MTFLEEVNHSRESSTVMPLKVVAILYQMEQAIIEEVKATWTK